MQQRYDFSKHALAPTYVSILQKLQAEHQQSAQFKRLLQTHAEEYGVADFGFPASLNKPSNVVPRTALSHNWVQRLRERVASALVAELARLLPLLEQLQRELQAQLQDADHRSLADLTELQRDLRESLDDLPELATSLRSLQQMDTASSGG